MPGRELRPTAYRLFAAIAAFPLVVQAHRVIVDARGRSLTAAPCIVVTPTIAFSSMAYVWLSEAVFKMPGGQGTH
jgi:hypothetical protein